MIGLSAAGLAAMVAVVLVVLSMTVWSAPDRRDYELAASFTDTSTGYFVMIVSSTESGWLDLTDGAPVEEHVAAAYEAAAYFDDHMEGLSGLPAVSEDPEIGALFQEFESAYGISRDRLLAIADAMPSMSQYFGACRGALADPISDMRLGMSRADLDQVMADYDRSRVRCTEVLEAIAGGEHEWMREYAQAQLDLWPPVREATEDVGRAGVVDDRPAIDEATERRTAAIEEFQSAQNEFQAEFRELTKERPSSESSEALIAALEAKMEES
ncbi:hypothetical protein [Ruania zhangjianzhongii]|uniref:hypothetical protein n=1 Tax=Ruania zhangjianzhongii TaxID=2603206 RepID=UPI0011C7C7B2|nr:hypothetical protein [Ruania zhangjianzhongii]